MFMSFLIREAPNFDILPWEDSKSFKNFFAVCFGLVDFCMATKAF